jgi:hypothetical protein
MVGSVSCVVNYLNQFVPSTENTCTDRSLIHLEQQTDSIKIYIGNPCLTSDHPSSTDSYLFNMRIVLRVMTNHSVLPSFNQIVSGLEPIAKYEGQTESSLAMTIYNLV